MLFISSWSLAFPFRCAAPGKATRTRTIRSIDTFFMHLFLICFGLAITHSAVGITPAFSCGVRSEFEPKEQNYLRSTLSRRQLQGFVIRRRQEQHVYKISRASTAR